MQELQTYNRELSWLSFNYRVLQEAKDSSVPLYERIKFLAIYSSNLDEFFRVRVASLRSLLRLKRKAQSKLDFDPEAFILRRSMPWADASNEGLQFVAFGKSFYAFDAQLKRMLGMDDGITDALFNFTTPISGSYYWCPPIVAGALDLSKLM